MYKCDVINIINNIKIEYPNILNSHNIKLLKSIKDKYIIFNKIGEILKCINNINIIDTWFCKTCGVLKNNHNNIYCSNKCKLNDNDYCKKVSEALRNSITPENLLKRSLNTSINNKKRYKNWSEIKKQNWKNNIKLGISKLDKKIWSDNMKKSNSLRTNEDYEKRNIKYKNTMNFKYGIEHNSQFQYIKDRWNDLDWVNNKIKKTQQTCLEKYGIANTFNYDKSKQTCLEKYGFSSYTKTEEYRELFNNKEWVESINIKKYNTMKLHNSFNKSKPEDKVYEILCKKYDKIERQYKSDVYPFNCDFYIPSEDLYIECNFHWTHYKEPFNENDINCINNLNKWKSKNTKFYNIAINTWTVRDVEKLRIAKENNLNYQIFYSLEEFMEKYKNLK